MSILTVLTLIFMTLKLTGYIGWHWLIVVSPSIAYVIFWIVGLLLVIFESPEEKIRRYYKRGRL